MQRKIFALLLCLVALICLLSACGTGNTGSTTISPTAHKVVLEVDDHFTVRGSREVYVEDGDTAVFSVAPKSGYTLAYLSSGVYSPEEGKLYVYNVTSDKIIAMKSRVDGFCVTFQGEHFTIEEGKTHYVNPGSTLGVTLILEEGYEVVDISGGIYTPETNSIMVQDVQGDVVVTIETAKKSTPPRDYYVVTFVGQHYQVEGGREHLVSPGATLEVVLTFDPGHKFAAIAGGQFDDATNSVTVQNVYSDITVLVYTSFIFPSAAQFSVNFTGVSNIPSQFVVEGGLITQPTNPSKEHYNFDGWHNTATGQKWNFAQDTVTGNLTLEARFSPKAYYITYDLGGVNADNLNPESYTYSETAEMHFAPLVDPTGEKIFIGWSKPCIEAGEAGDVTVIAKWIDAEELLGKYGFEANTADGQHCYIHYAEKGGSSEDKSTWYKAPNGMPQYYESTQGSGSAGYYIQATWNEVLRFGSYGSTVVFTGWKGSNALPVIVEGKGGDGSNVNFYLSTTIGNKVNTGFASFTKDLNGVSLKYDVAGLFGFEKSLSDKVALSIDFRMNGTGAFPINFYVRHDATGFAYAHGSDRFTLLYVDGRGNVVIGEDAFDARRMQYVGVSKTTIGNVGDGNWHNFKFEFIRTSAGFNVNIYIDDVKAGNTLSINTTDAFFTADNALNQLLVYGGAVQGN